MADAMTSVAGTDDASADADVSLPPEVNELLCFIQQKVCIMTVDDIVKICADFYSNEDIEEARLVISRHVIQKRIPKQKGTDAQVRTLTIMCKLCLDPSMNLPVFCAVNLAKLPPVDTDHVDVSAILSELNALRREVRAVAQLREEVKQLKDQLRNTAVLRASTDTDFPPLRSETGSDGKSFASLTKEFSNTDAQALSFKNTARKQSRPIVVGASATNKHIKAVATTRVVDVFVSRLNPHTVTSALVDCVNEAKSDVKVTDVTCVKLKSKYEELYSSFHVAIRVESYDMKRAIDLFLSAESWPEGVFVKRFFKPKNGEQSSA